VSAPAGPTALVKPLYTARATATGGRAGHAVTDDGLLDVHLKPPKEMGGPGGATNPEQLFAIGYAACFESALGTVARRQRIDLGQVAIDAKVDLRTTENGAFDIAVELDITLPALDDAEQATQIVAAAHQVCPYSRATRSNIDVKLTANGKSVDDGAEPST